MKNLCKDYHKDYCKVFVGNVPFQCSQTEFNECFIKITGFIKAEIVYKSDTLNSRGFGFLTFDCQENAKSIIGNNTIEFKNRILRFTEYSQHNDIEKENFLNDKLNDHIQNSYFTDSNINTIFSISNIKNGINNKNFLIVKNTGKITREILFDIFEKYGKVGRHYIASDRETGDSKTYAIIEMLNYHEYLSLLKQKKIKIDNNTILEISKWKKYIPCKKILNNFTNIKEDKYKYFY